MSGYGYNQAPTTGSYQPANSAFRGDGRASANASPNPYRPQGTFSPGMQSLDYPRQMSSSPALGSNPGYSNSPAAFVADSNVNGNLTSQMGNMNMGQDGAISKAKRRNRHAHHDLDQRTISSQAFNQSMGNAPQFLSQDDSSQNYQSSLFTPGLSREHSHSNTGSPAIGFQHSRSPQIPQSVPISTNNATQPNKVDPEQIPSIPRARDAATAHYTQYTYPTMEEHLPPPTSVPFVAIDQGNSSPKFSRLTLNSIPSSSDALQSTGLPLGLVLQPLAPLQSGESNVPLIDFGDVGPPRCRRCRAYVNPFMIFQNGGNKLVCNMCAFPSDVSPEYFAPTDPTGTRVDRSQRPELTTGTVEFTVPKEYWAKEPVGLHWLFVIDVTRDAVEKGFLAAFCKGIIAGLYGDEGENSAEVDDPDNAIHTFPKEARVGFITFDKAMHFFNCNESLSKAQMLVMPDTEEAFVPLGSEGLFVDPVKSRHVIEPLLRSLPTLFSGQRISEPIMLPVLETALSAMSITGGKVVCSMSTLPTFGPGKLFLRDKNDLHGIETEKKLFQTEHPGFIKLGAKMVEAGVGLDLFIAAPSGRYMDVATMGHAASSSGGETYFYPNFIRQRDALSIAQDLQRLLSRETGFQALMKVRCSGGLQVAGYHGNYTQHTSGGDLEFGTIDADKSIGVIFSYDGKLASKLDAHFQCALLYTTSSGERRVRCTNTVASVSEGTSDIMRFIDQDAVVNIIAREAATRMLERPLKEVRNALTEKTVDILAGYRKSFTTSHPPGQLVLPENLKELSMYSLGLLKCRAFRAGHEPSDRRTYTMRLLRSMSSGTLPLFLYPRVLALHSLSPESCFADPQTGHLIVPPCIRASFSRIDEGGAYLVDDGQICVLWFHANVSPNLLIDLFGPEVDSLTALSPDKSSIPVLTTHLNAQVRNILAYWGASRGSKSGTTVPLHIARQGLDGSEFEFARMLVEDRNNEAQSYVDWLVNVHRHIQLELAGQRKREDGQGGGLGVESAVAGITSLWSSKDG